MKKIALIVFIVSGLFGVIDSFGQTNGPDTLYYYDATSLIFRLGFIQGFEVQSRTNANLTMGIPIGADLRWYGSEDSKFLRPKDPLKFWQFGVSWMPMLFQKNFTSFMKIDLKYGFIRKDNYSVTTIGVNYYENFYNFGNMIGGELAMNAQEIPISLLYLHSSKFGVNYIMIGLNLQLVKFRVKRGKAFGY